MILCYGVILNKYLKKDGTSQQLFDDVDLKIDTRKHKPNQVAKMLFYKINELYRSKKIKGDELIILN